MRVGRRRGELAELEQQFDAIFVGVGLGRIGKLGHRRARSSPGVVDAIDFIAQLKLERADARKVGRRVVGDRRRQHRRSTA